ncbi:hypothetical protein LOK49_LG14G02150 [Camellia lanceoleosa]|uniref:Uncharacterized protein n=1 Tax=Camellia lanceoleosa TaxID=1840588 RepID=A0ACC0F9S6_9ERIC|nr:hypothetical protein LOK49_LG14G02150 [Camellia lanceoleosa]
MEQILADNGELCVPKGGRGSSTLDSGDLSPLTRLVDVVAMLTRVEECEADVTECGHKNDMVGPSIVMQGDQQPNEGPSQTRVVCRQMLIDKDDLDGVGLLVPRDRLDNIDVFEPSNAAMDSIMDWEISNLMRAPARHEVIHRQTLIDEDDLDGVGLPVSRDSLDDIDVLETGDATMDSTMDWLVRGEDLSTLSLSTRWGKVGIFKGLRTSQSIEDDDEEKMSHAGDEEKAAQDTEVISQAGDDEEVAQDTDTATEQRQVLLEVHVPVNQANKVLVAQEVTSDVILETYMLTSHVVDVSTKQFEVALRASVSVGRFCVSWEESDCLRHHVPDQHQGITAVPLLGGKAALSSSFGGVIPILLL